MAVKVAQFSGDELRVALAFQDSIAAAGIEAALRTDSKIAVVESACSFLDLIPSLRNRAASVAIVEFRITDAESLFKQIETIANSESSVGFVLVSWTPLARDDLERASQAGVASFICVDDNIANLIIAVRASLNGGWLSPTLGANMLSNQAIRIQSCAKTKMSDLKLTARQHDVLPLIADGWTDQEIAGRLRLSESSVKYHTSNLYIKFNAKNRAHLVHLAFCTGAYKCSCRFA